MTIGAINSLNPSFPLGPVNTVQPLWQKIAKIIACIVFPPLLLIGGFFAAKAAKSALNDKKVAEVNPPVPIIETRPQEDPPQLPKIVFKNSETSAFEFTRTVQMKNLVKHMPGYDADDSTLSLHGKKYTPISSKTRNYYDEPVASCGSSVGCREILVLDPSNSPVLANHLDRIQSILSAKGHSEDQIIKCVVDYVRDKIFPTHSDRNLGERVEAVVNFAKTDKTASKIDVFGHIVPILPIDHFITRKVGVCRHHALVVAYILDGLTKLTSDKTGKPFLKGIVQHIRDEVPGGAHAWVTYTTSTRKVHIDTLWNRVQDFTGNLGQRILEVSYGPKAIANQMKKVDIFVS